MFLEEADLQYRTRPIDISAGDQLKPERLTSRSAALATVPR
jgi:hypothetical protein